MGNREIGKKKNCVIRGNEKKQIGKRGKDNLLKGRLGKRKLRILELGQREIEENIYLEKEKYGKRKINGEKLREGKIGKKGNLEK